jgi:hypothetical protein
MRRAVDAGVSVTVALHALLAVTVALASRTYSVRSVASLAVVGGVVAATAPAVRTLARRSPAGWLALAVWLPLVAVGVAICEREGRMSQSPVLGRHTARSARPSPS